ncbi:hypothetical protein IIC44_02860 [Patescibacteria group bacterium]|nr:hypothetical protein [Patescibacteria group bacterium]
MIPSSSTRSSCEIIESASVGSSKPASNAAIVTALTMRSVWRAACAEDCPANASSSSVLAVSRSVFAASRSVISAFWKADAILRQALQGISDLITMPGIINVDFADLKSIMKNSGRAIFGMGQAKGEKRMEHALEAALHSPLLDVSIKGAKGVLFQVAAADDVSLQEIKEAGQLVKEAISSQAKIIFGAVQDKSLKHGEVRITVIATGFAE